MFIGVWSHRPSEISPKLHRWLLRFRVSKCDAMFYYNFCEEHSINKATKQHPFVLSQRLCIIRCSELCAFSQINLKANLHRHLSRIHITHSAKRLRAKVWWRVTHHSLTAARRCIYCIARFLADANHHKTRTHTLHDIKKKGFKHGKHKTRGRHIKQNP